MAVCALRKSEREAAHSKRMLKTMPEVVTSLRIG